MLTTREISRLLGVTERRIRQLLQSGVIQGERRGRDWFATRDAVEAARKRSKPGRPKLEKIL